MKKKSLEQPEPERSDLPELTEIKLLLPSDVARAWQRCTWLIVNETEKKRTDIMAEMVRDFLLKHGC